ncbi:MAG: ArsR family transcriptional regulator [Actinomycetia bacterium]|nr:ArsR family transcriptional regulator [Actinomycetes bacterium]
MDSSYIPGSVGPITNHDLIRLVRAMADPFGAVFYLNRDNKRDGWADSVEEAVASGRPFVVQARDDILVVDHDRDDPLVHEFVDEFCSDYDHVVCLSGQGEHQHGFILVDDPNARAGLQAAAKDFGIADAQFARPIRPPGSPHRMGGHSRLVGVTVEQAIKTLYRPPRQSHLGYKAQAALYGGGIGFVSSTNPNGDSSWALASATMGLINARYSDDQAWHTLMNNAGGESLRKKLDAGWSEAKARRWWMKQYVGEARRRVALRPTIRSDHDALQLVSAVWAWTAAVAWKGTGGANSYAVLAVFLAKAEELHRVHDLGLSVRQVAEGAGLGSPSTASNAIKRLIELGVLERLPRGNGFSNPDFHGPTSDRFSITAPKAMSQPEETAWQQGLAQDTNQVPLEQSESWGCERDCSPNASHFFSHDAFRHGALSKPKLRIWQALDRLHPMNTKQIAHKLLYKSTSTPAKHLKQLEAEGLVQLTADGWVQLEGDLDAIAERRGTAGKGERQRQQHTNERKLSNENFAKSNLPRFISCHIRATDSSKTITHDQLVAEYRAYCCERKVKEGPKRDHQLMAAITEAFEGATFMDEQSSQFHRRGTWFGINVVDSPIATLCLRAAESVS